MANQNPASALEAFFEQEAWLQRLARRLVQDDAAAQDLVQDTWLAAIQNPPEDLSRPQAWLSTVARRLASKQRSKLKPTLGEPLDAHSSRLEQPGWAAVRFETGTRLRKAVEGLGDPLKTTILLRFMERLPQAEIARRMQVTERTVRNRTESALDELRLELGQDFEGNELGGLSWAVMIAPLLEAGDIAAPLPVATGAEASAGLPPLALMAVAGIVISASVAWVAFTGSGKGPQAVPGQALPSSILAAGLESESAPGPGLALLGDSRQEATSRAGGLKDAAGADQQEAESAAIAETQEDLPTTADVLVRITGTLLIDGAPPEGYRVNGIPLARDLSMLRPAQGVVSEEDGGFELGLISSAMHKIWLAPYRPPGEGQVTPKVAPPIFALMRQGTPLEAGRPVHIAVRTGHLVLLGGPWDPVTHTGFNLLLTESDWSYQGRSDDGDRDGKVEFGQVPEGTLVLTEGGREHTIEIHPDEILTLNLRTAKSSRRPR